MAEKIVSGGTCFREKPLSGIIVLDLTQAYSGPFCTMHLADQGATVIKIEVPGKGDQSRAWGPMKNGASGYYASINRNKLGMTLNLKTQEGEEIFRDLVRKADVVCENFRVGTMEKLGLGYDSLKEINSRIIYASISGYGLEGPLAKRPCYDIVAQALGGMMSLTGRNGQMTKVGPAIADNYSGTYLALGVCMALYEREKTGLGRRLDVSMVDTVFSILETGVMEYTLNGVVPAPCGNRDPVVAPFDAFKAKDGMVVITCGTDAFWVVLCGLMGKPELATDCRFVNNQARIENYDALSSAIEKWTCNYTMEELDAMFSEAGIPFGTVLTMDKVCQQDIIRDRNCLLYTSPSPRDA